MHTTHLAGGVEIGFTNVPDRSRFKSLFVAQYNIALKALSVC